jgi:O-antigen ligase
MSLATNPSDVYTDRVEGWRAPAFVTIFVLALVTLKPFADLAAEDSLDIVSGRDVLTYLTFAGLAGICLALVWRSDAPVLASLRKLPFILLVLAVALLSALSPDAMTSMKRAALCVSVAVVAAVAPLLPRGSAHLASLLALIAAIVLGLSYFGVIFLPVYAIHQATDFVEPELAGDWRGVFAHKNDASLVFGCLAFIGIYIARAGRLWQGVAITALSLTFLVFTRGKSATALWGPALLMSFLVVRPGTGLLTAATALTPLMVLNVLGVGSTVFAPLHDFVAKLPIDPTFTGRVDVWSFAVRKLEEHPILGYGFDTFWNNTAMRFDSENGWLFAASHAHNGILDAALSMGMVGVALTLWAFAFQPLTDLRLAARRGADPALTALFAQIWLYALYASSLETFLFDRANPVWFLFLFSVFGLRYVANFGTSA